MRLCQDASYPAVLRWRRMDLPFMARSLSSRTSNPRPFKCLSAVRLAMPYIILPAIPADLPDIIAIYHAAFKDDPFVGQLMPNVPPEVKQAYDMHWYGREFEMSELNGLRLRKVVDGEGYDCCPRQIRYSTVHSRLARKSLAFAKWQYPYTLTPEQKAKKARLDRIEELEHPLPARSNRQLYDVFFAALREKKAKWMDESKDYCRSESTTIGVRNLYLMGLYCTSVVKDPC